MIRTLERFPWARLSDDRGDQQRIAVVRDDGRSWLAYTHGTRLPGPYASDVYVALMDEYRARQPLDGRLRVSFMDLLRRMRATPGGTAYQAIASAVEALTQLRIVSVGIWLPHSREPYCVQLLTGSCTDRLVDVTLTPDLRERLRRERPTRAAGGRPQVRPLDVRTYFRLPTPTARRLYRYLDYRRWAGTTARTTFALSLRQLQQELPVDRQFPSHVRRTLDPAHTALMAAGVLQDVWYEPRGTPRSGRPQWAVYYRLPTLADAPSVVAPTTAAALRPRAAGSAEIAPVVEEILATLRDVHSTGFYVKTVKALGDEATRYLLGGIRQAMREGVSLELARKLFTATARRRAQDVGVSL